MGRRTEVHIEGGMSGVEVNIEGGMWGVEVNIRGQKWILRVVEVDIEEGQRFILRVDVR